MKILSIVAALAVAVSSSAFVQPSTRTVRSTSTQLAAAQQQGSSWQQNLAKAASTAFVTAALWGAPAVVQNSQWNGLSAAANAKEMASGSGSRVNKDPESLLRYGLPINNKEVSAFSKNILCFSFVSVSK